MPIDLRDIDYRTALVTVGGKLRGSRARGLLEMCEGLAERGYDRLVLDLRELWSWDSIGTLAVRRATGLGLGVALVVGPNFDGLDAARDLLGLPRFASIAAAIEGLRARSDSALAIA